MLLSNLLHRSAKVHKTNPFIYEQDGSVITYEEADVLSNLYRTWLKEIIHHQVQQQQQQTSFHSSRNMSVTSSTNTSTAVKQSYEVVIAFLSSNCTDLLLAILGSLALDDNNNSNSNNTIIQIGNRTIQLRIRIALLNFRWSSSEISKALWVNEKEIDDHVQNVNYHHHMTMLIYEQNMEALAREACTFMKQKYIHSCSMVPLVSFKLSDITSSNISNKSNGNKSLSSPSISIMASNCSNSSSSSNYNKEAIILFTSGTTSGRPKGVKLSHIALFIQAMAKLHSPCYYDSQTKMLATTVPLFHVGGLNSAIALILAGGSFVFPLMEKNGSVGSGGGSSSFDPKLVVQTICDNDDDGRSSRTSVSTSISASVNTLVIVPAMLHSILHEISSNHDHHHQHHEQRKKKSFDNVRLILVGGQSISEQQYHLSRIYFPNARIVQTYACTEAASSLTFVNLYDPTTNTTNNQDEDDNGIQVIRSDNEKNYGMYHGTYAGLSPSHVEIGIFEQNDGQIVTTPKRSPPYKVGVIGTRGPHIMNGYWKRGREEEDDGGKIRYEWLYTNDLGYVNEYGGLYFCGRLNDVIRTGGESVFAAEVETVLLRHPHVIECAVFALPDERMGECVCAAIVLVQQNHEINDRFSTGINESIRVFCRNQKLSNYKRPRKVFVLDQLPRNSSGKVLKNELVRQMMLRGSKL